MNVSDFDSRRRATAEFLTEGLGGKLTRSAEMLMRASVEDTLGDWKQSAITYACGNIIERVFWVGQGRWMGYFDDVAPISGDEQDLLQEYAPLLNDAKLPTDFQNVRSLLMNRDSVLDESFFSRYFSGIPLRRPVLEWYPVFQASLIVSEYLTESPITAFFLFLRDGNAEKFQEHVPSPNAVMNALQENHHVYPYLGERAWRESVIAGFIRYTEFLSAMGDIFPGVDTQPVAETPDDIPIRIVDRDILYAGARPIPVAISKQRRSVPCFPSRSHGLRYAGFGGVRSIPGNGTPVVRGRYHVPGASSLAALFRRERIGRRICRKSGKSRVGSGETPQICGDRV
jgi:hypothetical protein